MDYSFRPEPLKIQLPPDIQYCLDGVLEIEAIDAFTYEVLYYYGIPEIIDKLHEGKYLDVCAYDEWLENRGVCGSNLNNYAHHIARHLPERIVRAFVADSIAHSRYTSMLYMHDLTRTLINQYDMTRKRTDRKVKSPSFIRRYVRDSMRQNGFYENRLAVTHQLEMCRRLALLPWPDSLDEAALLREMHRTCVESRQTEQYRSLMAIREGEQVKKIKEKSPLKHPKSYVPKSLRKVLIKSVTLATTVVGASNVAAFARGEPIVLPGKTFNLQVKRSGFYQYRGNDNLSHHVFGDMETVVLSLTGERLTNLCVHAKNMPVYDQLAVFSLHMQAGNEISILDKGNLYRVEPEGVQHPVLLERNDRLKANRKQPQNLVTDDYLVDADGNSSPNLRDLQRMERHSRRLQSIIDRYREVTKDHFIYAIETQLWGKQAGKVRRLLRDLEKYRVANGIQIDYNTRGLDYTELDYPELSVDVDDDSLPMRR